MIYGVKEITNSVIENSSFSALLVNPTMGEVNSPTDFCIALGCWNPMNISGIDERC